MSRSLDPPEARRIPVKPINRYGDEVPKVHEVGH
jgi:hypothetical protein